jgi:hypothetical protein
MTPSAASDTMYTLYGTVALHILVSVEHLLPENTKLGAPGRVSGTRKPVAEPNVVEEI